VKHSGLPWGTAEGYAYHDIDNTKLCKISNILSVLGRRFVVGLGVGVLELCAIMEDFNADTFVFTGSLGMHIRETLPRRLPLGLTKYHSLVASALHGTVSIRRKRKQD